jgi:hypothetical protein
MAPDLNRRNFMKTAGTAGIAGLAGCNTLSGEGSDGDEETDTSTDTATDTPQDPTYDIRVSALEYDLTDLATSETNQHDQAYVEDNYSAELGITVLNNGEEAGLEELGEVHLEDEEGERVETTEDGYVPEYAVKDGQDLTVRAEVDGEIKEQTVTVSKELPSEFYADARIQEDGEVLYDTDWSTPYSFDNHVVDRQAFLEQRAERRDELADDEIISESDLELYRQVVEDAKGEVDEDTLMEGRLWNMSMAMRGGADYEGSDASPNGFNMEKGMLEYTDFEPVYIGDFTNPAEPDVPGAGDGDGMPVNTQLAWVDGDWYEVGRTNLRATHIDDIDESPLVGTEGALYGGVSVLAEFERGNTELLSYDGADEIVEEAVTSPVTLNGNMTEIELSDDISWNALNAIRDNSEWKDVMVPMELATAVGTDVDGSVEMEGESVMDSRIKLTQ